MTARLWAEEAEASVIGAILSAASYDVEAGHRIYRRAEKAGLDPAHFGLASFVVLFSTIGRMVEANTPVDAVSVAAELDKDHVDARIVGRLRYLASTVPAFNAIEHHSRIVIEAATRRELEERAA